jgi:TolA-binding protein
LHALGKTEQATPIYARLVQERGTFSIPAGVKLASIYDAQGKHANARELLQDILARPSDNEFYQEARILFERLAVAK